MRFKAHWELRRNQKPRAGSLFTVSTKNRELLRVPAFRNLWVGQAISQLGDSLYYLVFLFMVDRLTGDPKMVGMAGVAQTLPFLLLSPYAGVLADRADRRRIMLGADVFSAITLFLFALLVWRNPTPPAWTLIATGAALSCINVFFAPAKSAAIPQVVPPDLLTPANALSLATQNLMPMLGIALSGTLLGALYLISPSYFFLGAILLNALSFAVSALFVARLPTLTPARSATSLGMAAQGLQDLKEGLHYLRGQTTLIVMVVLNFWYSSPLRRLCWFMCGSTASGSAANTGPSRSARWRSFLVWCCAVFSSSGLRYDELAWRLSAAWRR